MFNAIGIDINVILAYFLIAGVITVVPHLYGPQLYGPQLYGSPDYTDPK